MMGRCLAGAILILLLPVPQSGQEPLPSGSDVQRNLHRILSNGEYSRGKPDEDPEASIWALIARKIGELLGKITRLGASSPAVFWLILILCLGLLLAIFAHGGVILIRALRAARVGRAPEEEKSRKEDGGALLERAVSQAREGLFIEAIRSCHRAALFELDRRGLVRFHESLTSGDYRRQLKPKPREGKTFDALARVYEPAYFGSVPAGEAEFSESLRLARLLGREDPS